MSPSLHEIEVLLHAAWVVDPAARLREDDRRKAAQIAALLPEILRFRRGLLVDAASGRGGLALAAAAQGRPVRCLERDARRLGVCTAAAGRLGLPLQGAAGDLGDPALWPTEPRVVTALHACGGATDAALDRAVAAGAGAILLVPCCYGARGVHDDGPYAPPRAQAAAVARADAMGLPDAALVRGAFSRALIDAERTLRLEAAGYQTEVIEVFPVALSPFNRLWRARRVGEPVRMRRARERLGLLLGEEPV